MRFLVYDGFLKMTVKQADFLMYKKKNRLFSFYIKKK